MPRTHLTGDRFMAPFCRYFGTVGGLGLIMASQHKSTMHKTGIPNKMFSRHNLQPVSIITTLQCITPHKQP